MELKVQGRLLTEGILDAILARADESVSEFDIIGRVLSDAVKQDIEAMEQIFENQLCAIGCNAVAMFEEAT